MKRTAMFALASLGVILAAGLLLALVFPGGDNVRAIGVSAALALAVQLAAFAILRARPGPAVMIGWGIGSIVRFATLIVYGFLAQGAFGLPLTAALVSLATFLFATSILEPMFLKT